MPPALILVPDWIVPSTNSSVPPLSTVLLMEAAPDIARKVPLLTTNPESVPSIVSVAPATTCGAIAVPPPSTSSLPPLDTVVPLASPPELHDLRPGENNVGVRHAIDELRAAADLRAALGAAGANRLRRCRSKQSWSRRNRRKAPRTWRRCSAWCSPPRHRTRLRQRPRPPAQSRRRPRPSR